MALSVALLAGCSVPHASPGGIDRAPRAACADVPLAGPREMPELVPQLLYYEIVGTVHGPVWGRAFVTDFVDERPLSRSVVHLTGEGIVHRLHDPERGPILCYARPGAPGVVLGPAAAAADGWALSPDGAWLQYRDQAGLHIASTRHEERHTYEALSARWAPRGTGLWVGLTVAHPTARGARRFVVIARPGAEPAIAVPEMAGASWSADGRHLWYTRRGYRDTVFVADPDGSGARAITSPVALAANGRRRVQGDRVWFFPSSPRDVPHVAPLDCVADPVPLELPPRGRPRGGPYLVSPDGRHVAYACDVAELGANLLCVDAVAVAPVALPARWHARVTWSPDSAWLAFSVARAESSELWVVRADSSGRRTIAENAGAAAWAPDATRLAYYDRDRESLMVTDPAGSSPAPVADVRPAVSNGETLPLRVTWSDDATEIFYQGAVASDPRCSHVYRARADGTEPPAVVSKRRSALTFGLLSRATTPLPPATMPPATTSRPPDGTRIVKAPVAW